MNPSQLLLSNDQKKASTLFGVHVGVSAAAGSGKTAVLVQRYLEALLHQGASCEEILALTFTDKAANVMKMRLRHKLFELEDKSLAHKFDSAWI